MLAFTASGQHSGRGQNEQEQQESGHSARNGVQLPFRQDRVAGSITADGTRQRRIAVNPFPVSVAGRLGRKRRRRRRSFVDVDGNDVGHSSAIGRRIQRHDGVVEHLIGPRNGHAGSLPRSGRRRKRSETCVHQDGRRRVVQSRAIRVAADFVDGSRSRVVIVAGSRPAQVDLVGGVVHALDAEIGDARRRIDVDALRRSVGEAQSGSGEHTPEGVEQLRRVVREAAAAAGGRWGAVAVAERDGRSAVFVGHVDGGGVVTGVARPLRQVARVDAIGSRYIRIWHQEQMHQH